MGAALVVGAARRLDRHDAELLRFLVVEDEIDDVLGERRADKQKRFGAGAHEHADNRQQLFRLLDIKIAEQDGGVVHDDAILLFAAAQHGAGDGAALPVHAFHVVLLDGARMTAAHIQLAVLANELEYLAQLLRQFAVLADALGELRQLLAVGDGLRHFVQAAQNQIGAVLQTLPQPHRVPAGGDDLQAVVVDRLEHDSCGRCAIATILVKLPEHLPQQHGAHIGIAIGQVADAPRDEAALSSSSGGLLSSA